MPTRATPDYDNEYPINEYYKIPNEKLYYSNVVGSYIVNAITGEKYPWKVGTIDELKLFKVKNTTLDQRFNASNLQTAYYNSPEEYMEYKNVNLDETIINGWYNRINKLK